MTKEQGDWLVKIIRRKTNQFGIYDSKYVAKVIRQELLKRLSKKLEHSKDCLYVIEPQYYKNPSKERYCTCGAYDYNLALVDVKQAIGGDIE